MSAGLFNTIDVNSSEEQELLNKNYPAYNFDTIDGVTYEIDVTQAPKYDFDGNLINENSSRIINLKYNGNDVKDDDEFLIMTNNYRSSKGGNFYIFNSDDNVNYYSEWFDNKMNMTVTEYIRILRYTQKLR